MRCWACECHKKFLVYFFTVRFNGEAGLLENSKVPNLLSVMISGYTVSTPLTFGNRVTSNGIVIVFQSMSCKVWASDCQIYQGLNWKKYKCCQSVAAYLILCINYIFYNFFMKERVICFPVGQGSAGMPYGPIPSYFQPEY